jgi:predicted porin
LEKFSMKKTLIALAAVAVSSAAMAQATISGNLAVGYANDTTSAGVKTSGYGVDTANFTISASEDLGNGLKAFGSMAFENASEDIATNGNGATLGLSGGFGSVVFSSVETGDFLPVDGLTTSSMGTDADRITYTSPNFSGFTVQVISQDAIDGTTEPIDADARGLSSVMTYGVNYTNGPLSVDLVSADFRGQRSIVASSTTVVKSRLGVRASYDFGVAKVTYGQMKQDNDTAADVTETGLTIAAPVGPVSVSFAMATSKAVGAAKRDGQSLSVSYPLSKRTSINFYNEAFENNGAGKTKEQSLLLAHKF